MQKTSISWTHFSSNPLKYRAADGKVVWGCVHASEGCRFCYSEAIAHHYKKGGPFTAEVMRGLTPFLDEKELHSMLTYKPASGKMCFVGDMTDIFGPWVPDELLDKLFAIFALRPDVTWQLLTKRPERMREYMTAKSAFLASKGNRLLWIWEPMRSMNVKANIEFPESGDPRWDQWPLKNVRLGVSVEDQPTADKRIPDLLATPNALPWVSYEPALAGVDFAPYIGGRTYRCDCGFHATENELNFFGGNIYYCHRCSKRCQILPSIRLIVVGGESGPKARPCDVAWIRETIRQCREAGTKCFVKQMGSKPVHRCRICPDGFIGACRMFRSYKGDVGHGADGMIPYYFADGKGGDMYEWDSEFRVREMPEVK